MKAVVLLSGGLDSATVAAMARADGFEVYPLCINYRQRHSYELLAARDVARHLGLQPLYLMSVPIWAWGGSALTDSDIAVPTTPVDGIPVTYVPARNTVFISLAMGYAESIGAADVFIGVSSVDYSGYPDCRPEYIDAWNALAAIATKAPMTIHAPLVHMTKAETIEIGRRLGVDYNLTHSCYQPNGSTACGVCDSCRIRLAAFAEADG